VFEQENAAQPPLDPRIVAVLEPLTRAVNTLATKGDGTAVSDAMLATTKLAAAIAPDPDKGYEDILRGGAA
jgi:hypothetical protein